MLGTTESSKYLQQVDIMKKKRIYVYSLILKITHPELENRCKQCLNTLYFVIIFLASTVIVKTAQYIKKIECVFSVK